MLGTDWLWPWLSLTMLLVIYCSCIAPACHRQTLSPKMFLEYILLMYSINKFQCRQITRHRLMIFNEMDSHVADTQIKKKNIISIRETSSYLVLITITPLQRLLLSWLLSPVLPVFELHISWTTENFAFFPAFQRYFVRFIQALTCSVGYPLWFPHSILLSEYVTINPFSCGWTLRFSLVFDCYE